MRFCRFCGDETISVIDFGDMPIANYFVSNLDAEAYRFKLEAVICSNCFLFQLSEQPDPRRMFHASYPFFTGTSQFMSQHFKQMAVDSLKEVEKPLDAIQVLEIGCNDGTLLQHFAESNVRHLGIDPSSNVVELAKSKGVNAKVDFFTLNSADEIHKTNGVFDLILAANVICHIPDIRDFIAGIDLILSENGRFIFEEPYAGDVLKKTSYDQFYDEHVYIFSCLAVSRIFNDFGFELTDVSHQETHGGSMRYTIARKGARSIKNSVGEQVEREKAEGLDDVSSYLKFAENCKTRKAQLLDLLREIKRDGKLIAGYAATSKSTTVLNYCGIDSSLISFISDSTPEKQGTNTPGTYIPVVTPEFLRDASPDFIVLFAWNHEKEILEKESRLTNSGSKWIRFVPNVEILQL